MLRVRRLARLVKTAGCFTWRRRYSSFEVERLSLNVFSSFHGYFAVRYVFVFSLGYGASFSTCSLDMGNNARGTLSQTPSVGGTMACLQWEEVRRSQEDGSTCVPHLLLQRSVRLAGLGAKSDPVVNNIHMIDAILIRRF